MPKRSATGSVSRLVRRLSTGDLTVVEELWARFWGRLTGKATQVLETHPLSLSDAEDVAQCVFSDVVSRIAEQKLDMTANRRRLWRMMEVVTYHTTVDLERYESARRRHGTVQLSQASMEPADDPPPNFFADIHDELEKLSDYVDETAKNVAMMVWDGYGSNEIAKHLGITSRTVQRKMAAIRQAWVDHNVTFEVVRH